LGAAGNRLGSVARHLPHRQGVQTLSDPCCPTRSFATHRGARMTQMVEETQQPAEGRLAKSPVATATVLRLAGLSALLAGICYAFVGVFHPSNIASSVTTTRWEVVHLIACAMCFFALLGLAGLYTRQA